MNIRAKTLPLVQPQLAIINFITAVVANINSIISKTHNQHPWDVSNKWAIEGSGFMDSPKQLSIGSENINRPELARKNTIKARPVTMAKKKSQGKNWVNAVLNLASQKSELETGSFINPDT